MNIFSLTLTQMLNMLALIVAGFVITKLNILPDNSDKIVSKLETYIFVPALALSNQLANCTLQNFAQNFNLMLWGLAIVITAICISYPLSRLFVPKSADDKAISYRRQIYKYAMTFGNYGFMGNYIILGIWGGETFFEYQMFTFFIGVFCYGWGVYVLLPKSNNSPGILANLKNGLIKPPFLSMALGMILGISGVAKYTPEFLTSALKNAGNCMGPCAMILAGIVIGRYNIKDIIADKKVYITSLVRLIVLPALFVTALKFIGANDKAVLFTLIAFGTPLGLNTIVYPAAFGGETKTGASMALISHVMSVVTIPLMYLMLIG